MIRYLNKSKNLFISIIVPVYNVQQYIEECVQSLIGQNFQSYEIILINDGSTDDSGLICDNFAAEYSHIRVIHKQNGGTSSARNVGILLAKGEFLWFIDSDDLVFKDSLSILQMVLMNNDKVDVCNFTKINFIDVKTNLQKDLLFKDLKNEVFVLESTNIDIPSSVCHSIFKKKFLLEIGILFNESNHFEDEFFNLELYFNFHFKILRIDYPLYIYRKNRENSKTSSQNGEQLFKKCVSMIDLYQYINDIPQSSSNLNLINFRKKYYAEIGLSLLGDYIKNSNSDKKKVLLRLFEDKIAYIPLKGKLFKKSQIPRLLYNLNVRLFALYSYLLNYK